MAVSRQLSWPECHSSLNYYSTLDSSERKYLNSCREDSLSGESHIWDKFLLHPPLCTPPGSPQRDESDGCEVVDNTVTESEIFMDLMPTSELFECEQTNIKRFTDPVLQDCMWSGAGHRPGRVRNVSLSELNMVSTSTSCIDPTTFTAYPRQHNQVEHNYSLATPEPMRVPKPYSHYHTPSTSENSESEEDVIDVVTVDTSRTVTQTYAQIKSSSKTNVYKVRHNLQEVAERLSTHPYKRPKCLATNSITDKKPKQFFSTPCSMSGSMSGSISGSDCEEYGVKRSAHNVMERKRRSELRQHLHRLRDQLPLSADRPAKVLILVRAKDAIQQFDMEDRQFRQEYKTLKDHNTRLKQRLAALTAKSQGSF